MDSINVRVAEGRAQAQKAVDAGVLLQVALKRSTTHEVRTCLAGAIQLNAEIAATLQGLFGDVKPSDLSVSVRWIPNGDTGDSAF